MPGYNHGILGVCRWKTSNINWMTCKLIRTPNADGFRVECSLKAAVVSNEYQDNKHMRE